MFTFFLSSDKMALITSDLRQIRPLTPPPCARRRPPGADSTNSDLGDIGKLTNDVLKQAEVISPLMSPLMSPEPPTQHTTARVLRTGLWQTHTHARTTHTTHARTRTHRTHK